MGPRGNFIEPSRVLVELDMPVIVQFHYFPIYTHNME
uniref:Uncharacterized protein n=1 Tax=Anguilla anguilla TaxID=7936 RepID=A0A0E9TGV4_ANGAN